MKYLLCTFTIFAGMSLGIPCTISAKSNIAPLTEEVNDTAFANFDGYVYVHATYYNQGGKMYNSQRDTYELHTKTEGDQVHVKAKGVSSSCKGNGFDVTLPLSSWKQQVYDFARTFYKTDEIIITTIKGVPFL